MQKYNFFEFQQSSTEPFLFRRKGAVTQKDGSQRVIEFEVWMMPLDITGQYMAQEGGEMIVRQYIGYPDAGVPPTHECPYKIANPTEDLFRDIAKIETAITLASSVRPENPQYNDLDIAQIVVTAPSIYEAMITDLNMATRKLRKLEEERSGNHQADSGQSPPLLPEED